MNRLPAPGGAKLTQDSEVGGSSSGRGSQDFGGRGRRLAAAETIVAVPTIANTIHAVRDTRGSVPQMLVTVAAIDKAIGTSPATSNTTAGSRQGGGGGNGGGGA